MLQFGQLYRVIGFLGATACPAVSFIYLIPRIIQWNLFLDFTVFWTAGTLATTDARQVYDAAQLTAAQSWAVNPSFGPRPFPYPLTALLAFIPARALALLDGVVVMDRHKLHCIIERRASRCGGIGQQPRSLGMEG